MKNTLLALFANFFQNRMTSEEFVEDGGEDRIGMLPDCLLLEILSRLPSTKDAISTGTLSKRWKHLWTWVPTLVFNSSNYNPSSKFPLDSNSMSDFYSSVDKTLSDCRQSKLQKFVVDTVYDSRFELQANNWVRHAIERGVEELSLRFRFGVKWDRFFFVTSCVTDMTLLGCRLNPTGAISWKNLRKLRLEYRKLDEILIENILSGSPVLETLELVICYGFTRLDITSKSVKKLVLRDCINLNTSVVEINAPNIVSLTNKNSLSLRNMLLMDVSCLAEANLYFAIERHSLKSCLKK